MYFSSPTHRPDASGSSSGQAVVSTPTAAPPMSPTAGGYSSNNTANQVETPTPRMFGDTLHLHRSSANAKQVEAFCLFTKWLRIIQALFEIRATVLIKSSFE